MPIEKYPFEWLDLLITVTLNPLRTNIFEISDQQYKSIVERIDIEKGNLQLFINQRAFSFNNENELCLLIKQYHSSFIILLDHALENQKLIQEKNQGHRINQVYQKILVSFDELFAFFETRFSKYISLDDRVPSTYFAVTKHELNSKITRLKKNTCGDAVAEMLLNRLSHFVSSPNYPYVLTFRIVLYQRELVKALEEMDWNGNDFDDFSPLEQLLIYLNFNSKKFMNLLTGRIASIVNRFHQPMERMDKLLYFYKAFNQLHKKPDTVLNPKYRDLDVVISNWFVQELFYLERKIRLSVVPLNSNKTKDKVTDNIDDSIQKLVCILSTDQMALILRAMDDLRIIHAKSLNDLFRRIVPYLSTPQRKNLSFDAMRSKSYSAERRDKRIAIETLESIVKRIKDY